MVTALFNIFNFIGSEWVMWILMVLSVLSLGVILERMKNLGSQEKVGSFFWNSKVEAWMKAGKISMTAQEVADLNKKYPCLESGLLDALMHAEKKEPESLQRVMVSYLGRKKIELEKNLSFLGTLGSNTPFIGLFGTVLGIIKAFHDIGAGGSGDDGAHSVSLGLSEALVATAVGLLVAIPSIIAFNVFSKKIKIMMARAESLGEFLMGTQK